MSDDHTLTDLEEFFRKIGPPPAGWFDVNTHTPSPKLTLLDFGTALGGTVVVDHNNRVLLEPPKTVGPRWHSERFPCRCPVCEREHIIHVEWPMGGMPPTEYRAVMSVNRREVVLDAGPGLFDYRWVVTCKDHTLTDYHRRVNPGAYSPYRKKDKTRRRR